MARHATTELDPAAQQQLTLPDPARRVRQASTADEALVFRPPEGYDVPLPALRRILAVLLAEMGLHSNAAAR